LWLIPYTTKLQTTFLFVLNKSVIFPTQAEKQPVKQYQSSGSSDYMLTDVQMYTPG